MNVPKFKLNNTDEKYPINELITKLRKLNNGEYNPTYLLIDINESRADLCRFNGDKIYFVNEKLNQVLYQDKRVDKMLDEVIIESSIEGLSKFEIEHAIDELCLIKNTTGEFRYWQQEDKRFKSGKVWIIHAIFKKPLSVMELKSMFLYDTLYEVEEGGKYGRKL